MSFNKHQNRKTICLNMIVKNESHVILKTFDNLLSNIKFDYWVISDTGSTDNTQELIIRYFKEKQIPGELVEHEWQDFGYNRTKAIECAYNKADYLFFFDADDEIYGKIVLPDNLIYDKYDFIFGSGLTYNRPILVNNKKKWCYKGVLHEYLSCDNIASSTVFQGNYYIESGKTGDRSKDPQKYIKDAIVLKNAYEKSLKDDYGMSCRYAFYCAQSYRDSGINYIDDSIEWYKKCLKDNWTQEKFYSCIMIGNFYYQKNDIKNAYKYWLQSIQYDEERIEGIIIACQHMQESDQHLLVNILYHKYKDYKKNLQNKLFLLDYLYNNHFEYSNSISACYVNDHKSGYECCKKIIINRLLDYVYLKTTLNNLFIYKEQIEDDNTDTFLLFSKVNELFNDMSKHNDFLNSNHIELWDLLFNKNKKNITKFKKFVFKNNTKNPKIILTFTTCKRFDLFKQTINSILNTWLDIDKIDYWFCVDDNSSQEDREKMTKLYSWIEYYMKDPEEKGHMKSMNIIWDKLNRLKPKYWIHMEDDFLFFEKMNYVEDSIKGLKMFENSDNVKQILFNNNYGETISGYNSRGHISKGNGFALHDFKNGSYNYINCHYWPHYSFRPSLIDVQTILNLGNYDSENTFFERSYADKWEACGYKSAFFEKITNIHIGRLTSERNDPTILNAYKLNNEDQFVKETTNEANNEIKTKDIDNNNIDNYKEEMKKNDTTIYFETSHNIKILNLEKRPDRKDKMIQNLEEAEVKDYEFIKAIDGEKLVPDLELYNLFKGNDFGSRRGFIGCALSHYQLWKNLIQDEKNEYYIIMEDDFTLCRDFKSKYTSLTNEFIEKDIIFLGYHMFEHERQKYIDIYHEDNKNLIIEKLNKKLYVGGFFGYSINKNGAKQLLKYIEEHGIKHGIDYLIKIIDDNFLQSYELQPMIMNSVWNEGGKKIDSNIQFDNQSIDFSIIIKNQPDKIEDKYIFIPDMDQFNYDLYYKGNKKISEYMNISEQDKSCVGFNTLGFFKTSIYLDQLKKSPYYKENDGIYIKKILYDRFKKIEETVNEVNNSICHENMENMENTSQIIMKSTNMLTKKFCFIHSCYIKDVGIEILEKIISRIQETGLINHLQKIFIINIGETINEDYFKNDKIKIIHFSDNIKIAENSTLNILHSFCETNVDCEILYLHTKGIRMLNHSNKLFYKNIEDWVNLMLYFLVDQYNFCFELLKKHDVVGCNYTEKDNMNNYKPHFSGNFWWANSNYIKQLKKNTNIIYDENFDKLRHESEFMILSNELLNYYSIYNSNVNHYVTPYPKEKYIHYDLNLNYKLNKKYRVKLIGNWADSKKICKEWSNMCENGFLWKNIEITWDNKNIDYYVIINYPTFNERYEANKTIIFQMEPWCYSNTQNWGVKTWGKWSTPDEKQFLSVNGRKQNTYNNVFWQLGLKLPQLIDLNVEKMDKISSICSSKYFDPGHIARIDFLKFVESKNDFLIDIYNKDNYFNFKGYKGTATENQDKFKGILPYKYYFMIENNFEENFITEKLWEPILCESLVFYYGCPNVSKYINPLAFVEIDINDFEKSYQIIKKAVEEDWWSQRIEIIREEKKKILNELAFFPRIQKIIEANENKI